MPRSKRGGRDGIRVTEVMGKINICQCGMDEVEQILARPSQTLKSAEIPGLIQVDHGSIHFH